MTNKEKIAQLTEALENSTRVLGLCLGSEANMYGMVEAQIEDNKAALKD